MPFSVGKVGQVAAGRHPILIEDVAAQNEWVVRPEWAKREEIRSFAGHPLIFRDKLLGVIAVFSRHPLGPQEFTWLSLFANQAALAISNACAEQALQSSERNLNQIINAIPTFVGVMRADGWPLYENQAVTDYLGLTLEDVQREDFRARIFHPEDLERLREARRLAFIRPVPFENEIRVLGKDGKYRWFLFRYKPLLDEAGKIDRWYMAAFDIADRKQAENVRLEERTRIARELHDTMLQSLQAVLLKFHGVTYQLSDRPELQRTLEGVVDQARQAVIEGRDAVQGLRSSTIVTNDLARAIRILCAELED